MKPSRFRWVIIALIAIGTVINYVDRNAMAVMWPEISADIGATKEEYALLVTIFMVFYATGQFAFGRFFDKLGVRMGFAVSIATWSLSIMLHGMATSIMSFSIFRAMLGFTEAGAWPGAVKANAEWFPPKERALAQGVFNAGASIGAIISAPLIAGLFLLVGWKFTFVLVGLVGFVWLLPWLIIYKAGPASHPWVNAAERALILDAPQAVPSEGPEAPAYQPTLRQILSHRQSWGIIGARFFLDPVWWLFVSWLPIYLAETFGFDVKQIGIFAWVPYVGAMIGSLFGGWLSGLMISRGWSVDRARKVAITLGAAIMGPALIAAPQAPGPVAAVLIIAAVLFGFQVAIGNIQTLPGDVFHQKSVGTLAGVSGMAAVAGTLIITWLVPAMTKVSYAPIFVLVALLVPVALFFVLFVTGRIAPVPSMPTSSSSSSKIKDA